MKHRGCIKLLTFSLTISETVRDSMRHDTVQARMWKSVYIKRVLVEDLIGGQKEQHNEHGAGPQQQHIYWEEGDKHVSCYYGNSWNNCLSLAVIEN